MGVGTALGRSLFGRGRGRGRGRGLALACVLAATTACGGAGGGDGSADGSDRPGATVPEDDGAGGSWTTSSSSGSGSSASIDITTKPATITVEYADAVMDELDRVLSDAIREFVAADGPTKGFDDKLNAVYDEPSLENKRQVFGKFAADGTSEFAKPPGDIVTTVRELLKAETECVVLAVDRDVSAQFVAPSPDSRRTGYIALVPTTPTALNRTPWSIVFDGNVLDGDDPKEAC